MNEEELKAANKKKMQMMHDMAVEMGAMCGDGKHVELLPEEPAEDEPEVETVPAEVTSADDEPLNLSYAKSFGVTENDLAVKYVARDTIRHPVFLWGDPGRVDLENEYFTRETDFWDSVLGKSARPLTWDHAQDPEFMADPLIGQTNEWEDDDIARWAISTLKKGHKYRRAIDALIERKSLGSAAIAVPVPVLGASSDSAPQYVKRVQVGKSVWLARWPWFATALTVSPCEPRMIGSDGKGVEFFKSLGIQLPETTDKSWDIERATIDLLKIKYIE